jgi:NAD(P) transhydrogenase subunit alpha
LPGYRAVIEAAHAFGRFLNGQITAAGKVPPAKVFIAGAGVAGLARSARRRPGRHRARQRHARRSGRPGVSLGGEFVKVDYEKKARAAAATQGDERGLPAGPARDVRQAGREVDIIITTALIPGKPAPKLITAEMVQA